MFHVAIINPFAIQFFVQTNLVRSFINFPSWQRLCRPLPPVMPKKVSFRVVSCSGWEDQFPAKQLEVSLRACVELSVAMVFVYASNGKSAMAIIIQSLFLQVQSPFVRGWRSPRYYCNIAVSNACTHRNLAIPEPAHACMRKHSTVHSHTWSLTYTH